MHSQHDDIVLLTWSMRKEVWKVRWVAWSATDVVWMTGLCWGGGTRITTLTPLLGEALLQGMIMSRSYMYWERTSLVTCPSSIKCLTGSPGCMDSGVSFRKHVELEVLSVTENPVDCVVHECLMRV